MIDRTIHGVALLLLAVALGSCESIVDATGVPYVERLVIRAVLSPNVPADSIRITRTLPLTIRYDTALAAVTNAAGFIEQGSERYPLSHSGNGYYQAEGLVPVSGRSYRLVAQWSKGSVTASTTIPYPVTIERVKSVVLDTFNWDGHTELIYGIEAVVVPIGEQVYQVSVVGSDLTSSYSVFSIENVLRRRDTASNGMIHLMTRTYTEFEPGEAVARVYSWDPQYYDFLMSYIRDGDDPLQFVSTAPVHWNIQGDGIGMFIGRVISEKRLE